MVTLVGVSALRSQKAQHQWLSLPLLVSTALVPAMALVMVLAAAGAAVRRVRAAAPAVRDAAALLAAPLVPLVPLLLLPRPHWR